MSDKNKVLEFKSKEGDVLKFAEKIIKNIQSELKEIAPTSFEQMPYITTLGALLDRWVTSCTRECSEQVAHKYKSLFEE